ncbi:hypothetical protein C1646_677741 [Rhizophagus diaphanus]|nr:hypothetical protein C1646_677741 [Rhizophagus diaphanus] [Rhizophagus sp. MUCL 43196]
MNQYEKSAAKNKSFDKEIVEVDRGQTSTTPNIRQTSTSKKVDILIVLHYSIPLFKASKDELSDEVEIVEVAHGQTSTTPATDQVYQKNYRDPFVLDISQVLIESCQKSKTSQDLEESHTDKEMAKSESNDNDNRSGKKRKVARRQIDQSDNNSETDEKNTEMKVILKIMPPELTLRYDEKFTNETNVDILQQLISRLIASMKPQFSPLYKQINNWLAALHKHRRKKSRKVKDAISLFKHNDDRVKDYDKTEVLNILKDTCYHSLEDSETDKEQPDGKRKIIIYNFSWCSDKIYCEILFSYY